MRDFVAHVRQHLSRRDVPEDRFDEFVEELASELESRYTTLVERGAPDEDAWKAALAQIPSWASFAHELAVDLFEIDLSRIVSKYVADTERNLDDLFKAAKASDAVLLFDDTDHLFNSNGEDSGRFPNFDVNQLRQRIESYDGVVLLGADDRTHIDPRLARQCDEVVAL